MALYTYPSNKLEYLVKVLSKLFDYEKKDIFAPTQLIVGSRGMQHWLSMQLAECRSIAMNLNYDMVNGYILDICYKLTGKQDYKKSYSKDILTWRIYKLIDEIDSEKLGKYCLGSNLKRYQLSAKIAEVFSKYISYRTDWLELWEKGQTITSDLQDDEDWQMQLWQSLVKEIPDTPYNVQKEAVKKLSANTLKKHDIPSNIYIFGVNTISPKNLSFLYQLANFIDIHILYINPCSEYWYDLKKTKISTWLNQDDYELQPLLANLGQQGKEFFNELLNNEKKQEFSVFDNSQLDFAKLEHHGQSQLVSVQRNLLELNCENYSEGKDNTISVNSCHSPLREVQVLHDRLLDMIKADSAIKPRDILVMCPNIEDYAPYIDSVFSRYGDDKKLPCSIADRTLLDSEALAASFIDLLQLPESNFEVNKILDYLEVPAIQQKFKISNEDLEAIRYWLKEACIHHSNDGKTFSWSWGLRRLILGFSFSDSGEIINDSLLTVPIIEGSEISKLGGLYELLELLAEYSEQLQESRTFDEWHSFLLEMFTSVFEITNDEEYIAKKIKDLIAKTVETTKTIISDEKIDLYTIRYCLISQLSEPIINNHFLNGKVTFCSMTPMRNVPFKVVAMLGLNNGSFPRRDIAISFDLMAKLGRRVGDRTKRDDDRYLFLESILSARQNLYLSYIGKSVKTNVDQEASLILKEFISYLGDNYNWKKDNVKEYPLHAFSPECYSDKYRSYDEAWLRLIEKQPQAFYENTGKANVNFPEHLTISKLVNIFDNPLRAYANYGLELKLEDNFEELEDSEPFDIDGLEEHSLKQQLFESISQGQNTDIIQKLNKLSGKLPESVLTDDELNTQVQNMQILVESANISNYEKRYFEAKLESCELSTNCYVKENQIMFITTSNNFGVKHRFEAYLRALLVAYVEQQDIRAIYHFLKDDKPSEFVLEKIEYSTAKELLEHYVNQAKELITKPKLVHLALAEALFVDGEAYGKKYKKSDKQKQVAWDNAISDENNYKALDQDKYFKLFYSEFPSMSDFEGEETYKGFFEVLNTYEK
ncbi:exodeoxyribonuclease V subunit gamma [Francisella frigiditurris]|uniref:RecBCD enzyme subunit RecC n=1 Tax=Francisella frigiditurris TaxID=1542390 RepID=A0A1J0KVP3_9GAMM|nr:exodeoxyribonuclease V subunit gamma [Francisella frigiditurris]APC97861.1 exodeoxyribonuclease V, gamma subunit [Francisella frigiditurris]